MTERIFRGRVVTADAVIDDGVVLVRGERIEWVGPAAECPDTGPALDDEAGPGGTLTVLPGMVDVHCHGGGGVGFPDATTETAPTAVRFHRRRGTTTMLASLVSAPEDVLVRQTAALAALWRSGEIAGVHLEGPFLAVSRCGAQDPASIVPADTAMLGRVLAAGDGAVRSMTFAPEVDGVEHLIDALADHDVRGSVGHTDTDAGTVTDIVRRLAGPVSATHLFNGMPPFHHRAPGPVAACLAAAARGEMMLELIGDGVHLDPVTVRTVVDLVGPDRIAFVSDAMAAAGSADGPYRLGALDVTVTDGVARLTTGGAIAGGTSTVLDIVRRAVDESGIDLVSAVRMGSTIPAAFLGLAGTLGRLEAGLRADLVITDDRLAPVRVVRAGEDVT